MACFNIAKAEEIRDLKKAKKGSGPFQRPICSIFKLSRASGRTRRRVD
jgi:hypothetical protein